MIVEACFAGRMTWYTRMALKIVVLFIFTYNATFNNHLKINRTVNRTISFTAYDTEI